MKYSTSDLFCRALFKTENGQVHVCGEKPGHLPPHRCAIKLCCRVTWLDKSKGNYILKSREGEKEQQCKSVSSRN